MSPARRFGKILVAVDGSESARRAVEVAIELAKSLSAELTVLNILETPVTPYASDKPVEMDVNEPVEAMRTDGERAVPGAASLAEERGVKTVQRVVRHMGSAAEGITAYAKSNDIDLIVVGTRGLGGIRKLVVGSVASGVTGSASCCVLVVR